MILDLQKLVAYQPAPAAAGLTWRGGKPAN
jgi:hypothetical protein